MSTGKAAKNQPPREAVEIKSGEKKSGKKVAEKNLRVKPLFTFRFFAAVPVDIFRALSM